jgi:hypothetical protein
LGENSCKLTSGLGLKKDAFGTDCTIDMEDGTKEAQVKPFTRIVEGEGKIKILGSSSVQLYRVPLFVFVNVVDKVVLIFENSGLDVSSGSYVFPVGSLITSASLDVANDTLAVVFNDPLAPVPNQVIADCENWLHTFVYLTFLLRSTYPSAF